MDPDYRAMLLAALSRIEQLTVQVEAILLEASDTETVDRVSGQLAERRRVLADMRQKLKRIRQMGGLNRRRRDQSTNATTGSHRSRTGPGQELSQGKTRGEYAWLECNHIMSVAAWRHGASRSIAYWIIRHEPSGFMFAKCANRKDAIALAEKVYAMFPEEFWQTNDVDVISAKLQPLKDSILTPYLQGQAKRPTNPRTGSGAEE